MDKLKDIVATVLNIDLSLVDDNLSRDNTEEWDSFNHLMLISQIEKIVGINITINEVEGIKTFFDLRTLVRSKCQ